jgi:hypothetical protein
MRHLKSTRIGSKLSRRTFIAGGLAAGTFALGSVFAGKKDLLAQSVDRLGGLRWEIAVDGKVIRVGSVSLDQKEEVLIPVNHGIARMIVDHGRIYLPDDNSICSKKICSLMGAITKPGEKITCLPNKLVISIV